MIEIGRLCIKNKGKEKGKKIVILDIVDDTFVLIDGNVKRRKCNINHLQITPEKLNIEKNASSEKVKEIFKERGIIEEKKESIKEKRPRNKGERPKKIRPRITKKDKDPKAKKQTEEEIVEKAMQKADEEITSKKE